MPDVRADFSIAAWAAPENFEWIPSPGGEVERMMLDRVGDEVAVATSLVRYPAGSRFPAHEHALGEEYLVLEGEFADEHGRYGPGTYVRNPPGSRHTPFSDPGCVIWVKLRQFRPDDQAQFERAIDVHVPARGHRERLLHEFAGERVAVLAAAAGAAISLPAVDHVQELVVVDAAVRWRDRRFGAWGWIRVPAGQGLDVVVSKPGRLLYKTRPAFALPDGRG